MADAPSCKCGTFAIGHCTVCGVAVCGERACSGRHDSKLTCTACLADIKAEADVEEARRRVQLAEDLARAEATDSEPLEMSGTDAFKTMFTNKAPTRREMNSAQRILSALGPEKFTAAALRCLVEEGVAGTMPPARQPKGFFARWFPPAPPLWRWDFRYGNGQYAYWSLDSNGRWRHTSYTPVQEGPADEHTAVSPLNQHGLDTLLASRRRVFDLHQEGKGRLEPFIQRDTSVH